MHVHINLNLHIYKSGKETARADLKTCEGEQSAMIVPLLHLTAHNETQKIVYCPATSQLSCRLLYYLIV